MRVKDQGRTKWKKDLTDSEFLRSINQWAKDREKKQQEEQKRKRVESTTAWRKKNPEKAREYFRLYRRKWRKENPEKEQEMQRMNYRRKKNKKSNQQ